MKPISLTHFQALLLFALVISLAFAFLSRPTARERLRYFVYAFLAFLLIAIGFGWLMYFFPR
jgi:hypothetical protein